MTIVGIYSVQESEYEKDSEDRTWERHAAFDTERGVWLASSDGRHTDEWDPEDLVDADADELVDRFAERNSSRTTRVVPESSIPGTVKVIEPAVEPETSLIEDAE
jgi:hypothetical protein